MIDRKAMKSMSEAEMAQFAKKHAGDYCWPIPYNAPVKARPRKGPDNMPKVVLSERDQQVRQNFHNARRAARIAARG